MYQIGEFSRITELPVKTLRFYHEEGLLVPAHVDPQNGYRYYNDANLVRARVIKQLRGLEFSLDDIGTILKFDADEDSFLEKLQQQKEVLQQEGNRLSDVNKTLDEIILFESSARRKMSESNFEIEEKQVEDMVIGGIRMKGKYSECGKAFSKIGRKFGRHIRGDAMLLHFDAEYKEDDADFEACIPINKGESTDEIQVREIAGGRCVSLLHQGPYETLGRSYEVIARYVNDKEYEVKSPTREIYIKGPGMIFKGNPKNYITEIQMMIEE